MQNYSNICEHINTDNLYVGIFTYKNFYELQTPVNTNFGKSWFLQDTNMRISAIIRIYMLAANFYRDWPMLGTKYTYQL